jgi:hypothetical protein
MMCTATERASMVPVVALASSGVNTMWLRGLRTWGVGVGVGGGGRSQGGEDAPLQGEHAGGRLCWRGAAWVPCQPPSLPSSQRPEARQALCTEQGPQTHREVVQLGVDVAREPRRRPAGAEDHQPRPPGAQRDAAGGGGRREGVWAAAWGGPSSRGAERARMRRSRPGAASAPPPPRRAALAAPRRLIHRALAVRAAHAAERPGREGAAAAGGGARRRRSGARALQRAARRGHQRRQGQLGLAQQGRLQ